MTLAIAVAVVAAPAVTATQDVALKDLVPKGMVIGVAINQRQSDGSDTAAVDIITKQFNQISPAVRSDHFANQFTVVPRDGERVTVAGVERSLLGCRRRERPA